MTIPFAHSDSLASEYVECAVARFALLGIRILTDVIVNHISPVCHFGDTAVVVATNWFICMFRCKTKRGFSGTKPDRVTYNTLLGTRPPRNGRWASQRFGGIGEVCLLMG